MKDLVQNFANQLKEAIQIGSNAQFTLPANPLHQVVVTGLGGSGIGGTIMSEIVAQECAIPVLVNKDYFLPAFVNKHTLVIVSSYSGNTEETLQALDQALAKGAKIVCITSGGKVADIAREKKLDLVIIPGGMPPRSCLGYSLTQLFYAMKGMQLISANFEAALKKAIALIEAEDKNIKAEALSITDVLFKKTPVIYAVDGFNGVATRFRQQINENSKMLCWHHIIPEMNHNELVGWAEMHPEAAVVILRNKEDYSRSQARIEISKEVFAMRNASITEIWSKGDSMIERSIYLVYLTDWISCYLADKKAIDPVEVDIINHLKGSLAKI
ncbi:MAG: bifunctional phosphoglucose/phosphomannose isomerase [Bacteroidota bacterium]